MDPLLVYLAENATTIGVGTTALATLIGLLTPKIRAALGLKPKFKLPVFRVQAIDSNDKKLSLMEWDNIWEPGIPLAATAPFTQGDKQQLLWGYPGILWQAGGAMTQLIKGPNLGKVLIKVY